MSVTRRSTLKRSLSSPAPPVLRDGPELYDLKSTEKGLTMNLEQNKAIVRGYLNEIVNNENMMAFDQYLSEDVVFNEAKGFREQYPARMQATRRAFPDFHLIIRDQIAEGDKVVTRVTFHGTHQGQFNGIAATGRQVTWPGMAMDRIANGKVVEMWHVQSTAGLLQQIGAAAPTPSRT
jgi:steroid delta-isomerase-like uncharacterized protein